MPRLRPVHWRLFGRAIATLAGAALPLSMAPWGYWVFSILSPALLAATLINQKSGEGLIRGWLFGTALFATGASWIYISIHVYGHTPAPLAFLLTAIFCVGLGLFYAFSSWFFCSFVSDSPEGNTLGFAAVWVLGEWLRSFLFSGFPWLLLGHAHTDTWLGAGFAPIFGVFGLSLICAISAAGFAALLFPGMLRASLLCLLVGAAALGSGKNMSWNIWTQAMEPRLRVAAVQPNIPQERKWLPEAYWPTLDSFASLSEPLWSSNDLVIWPEAALPALRHELSDFLTPITTLAESNGAGLITGLLVEHDGRYYNAAVGMAGASGEYRKQRLVPFGEYVPFEKWLRGLIRFFNLPTSTISPGTGPQPPLQLGNLNIATSICYEIVYPDAVRKSVSDAELLLTISNDGWFGRSIGPDQHLQIARLRAMENGKPLIRATGRGHTAIIDYRGRITRSAPFFKTAVLEGSVLPRSGRTPFNRVGSIPILAYCWLTLILSVFMRLVIVNRKNATQES